MYATIQAWFAPRRNPTSEPRTELTPAIRETLTNIQYLLHDRDAALVPVYDFLLARAGYVDEEDLRAAQRTRRKGMGAVRAAALAFRDTWLEVRRAPFERLTELLGDEVDAAMRLAHAFDAYLREKPSAWATNSHPHGMVQLLLQTDPAGTLRLLVRLLRPQLANVPLETSMDTGMRQALISVLALAAEYSSRGPRGVQESTALGNAEAREEWLWTQIPPWTQEGAQAERIASLRRLLASLLNDAMALAAPSLHARRGFDTVTWMQEFSGGTLADLAAQIRALHPDPPSIVQWLRTAPRNSVEGR